MGRLYKTEIKVFLKTQLRLETSFVSQRQPTYPFTNKALTLTTVGE